MICESANGRLPRHGQLWRRPAGLTPRGWAHAGTSAQPVHGDDPAIPRVCREGCHGRAWRRLDRVQVRVSTRTRLSEARTTKVMSTAGTQRTWPPFTT